MRAFVEAVRIGVAALLRARLRSFLTTLGILIGIAAVVVVTALGKGARQSVGSQIDSLGANVVYLFSRPSSRSGIKAGGAELLGLTDRDAAAIRREIPLAKNVTVFSEVDGPAITEFFNERIKIVGSDVDYLEVRGYQLAEGRNFTGEEVASKAKVLLIGTTASSKLFGEQDPIGHYVRIGRHPYRVIGTLAPKGASPFGVDQDDRVVMPIGTWRARVSPTPGDRVQLIMASLAPETPPDTVQEQIDALLRQTHRIAPGDEPDFRVGSQAQFREMQESVYGILTGLLVSVAAIALFVGGVGVMNIMLVNVTERRREIGVRMALGARASDIALQFLVEAVLLALAGGVGGVLLAAGGIVVAREIFAWEMSLSVEALAVALFTSLAIGVVFGLLPARRAAALDPMDALRHE